MKSERSPVVVLLDEGWFVTVYLAAGLRNAGCDVHIVTTPSGVADSRYLGAGITVDKVPETSSPDYVAAVEHVLARWPAAKIMAMTETIQYRLWDSNPPWLDRVFPATGEHDRILARDKASVSELVNASGVSIPLQFRIPTSAHLDAAMDAVGFPLVIKGTTGSGGSRVRIAGSPAEARRHAAAMSDGGDCFVQQFIEGTKFLVGGLFDRGRPIRVYGARVIEAFPPMTGPSIRHISDTGGLEAGLGAIGAIGCSGIALAELIRTPDGVVHFLECNQRPWGSMQACARAGVDLFAPLKALLQGGMPEADLRFNHGVTTAPFPQLAMARISNGTASELLGLLLEAKSWLHAPWREPGLALHLARHAWWKWSHERRCRAKEYRANQGPVPISNI